MIMKTPQVPVASNLVPTAIVSSRAYREVSDYRRAKMQREYEQGLIRDGSSSHKGDNTTAASVVTSSVTPGVVISKSAQHAHSPLTGTSGGDWRGDHGSGLKQMPEVYSPLWLNSNLNLPRDRATMNAWCRSFFALQPFVQNAINLHSTYPISKLNIKSKNKRVENFFGDMNEEIELENVCTQIAQEYWLLGEAFPYAELDQANGKWSKIILQNPDYIVVKRSAVASDPLIMLRPDENLKKIIFSNKPSDVQQRQQLNPTIIEHIRRGENIPLDNFYVTHLARRLSSYEVRGTSLVVSCFRQLMLFDMLRENKYIQSSEMVNPLTIVKVGSADYRPTPEDLEIWRHTWECHDEETEVLTDQGFKKFNEAISYTEENGTISNVEPKAGMKVACFNPSSSEIEYHHPSKAFISQYNGDMVHFNGEKVDCLVTPNHKMWVSEQVNGKYGEYRKVEAQDIPKKKKYWKFNSQAKFVSNTNVQSVSVAGKEVPIELYMKVLGYILSEGCVYENFENRRYDAFVTVSQLTSGQHYGRMREVWDNFAATIGKKPNHEIRKLSFRYENGVEKDAWSGRIHGKEISAYFKKEIGVNGSTLSTDKHIPRWMLELEPRLLKLLLNSLLDGDGTRRTSKYGTNSKSFSYSTISKQLADDVYELAYKVGYVPNICVSHRDIEGRKFIEYIVLWSDTNYGTEPIVYTGKRHPLKKNGGGAKAESAPYSGKVWCFTVPTGLFITRRNGKITIQGNSAAADKNFKLFTHDAVTVERVGANSGILDINPDVQQLLKEIFMGLNIPEVIMTGGGDITYNNGGVSLDVLKQRYNQFRNMMAAFLKKKIFAPISKLNDFYEYENGEKKLVVPEVDWNQMSLFDTADYIQMLLTLSGEQDRRVSKHTLYRALGLEWEEEQRKIKKEDIREAIRQKELMSLSRMQMNELRALGEDDDIPEITEPALNEDSPYTDATGAQGGPGLPGAGNSGGLDLGLGGPPPSGPSPGLGGSLPPPPPSAGPTPGGAGGGASPASGSTPPAAPT